MEIKPTLSLSGQTGLTSRGKCREVVLDARKRKTREEMEFVLSKGSALPIKQKAMDTNVKAVGRKRWSQIQQAWKFNKQSERTAQ